MFVAIQAERGVIVSGLDVARVHGQATTFDSTGSYRCPFCGSSLSYNGAPDGDPLAYFNHDDRSRDCVTNANVSTDHRLGQEVLAKRLCNRLPVPQHAIQLDLERRIGTPSQFIITDVRINEPVQLAAEVVHTHSEMCLRRRLQILFAENYSVMFIVVTNGTSSPTEVEQQLQPVAPIRIGRFDPESRHLTLGSVIDTEAVALDTSQSESVQRRLVFHPPGRTDRASQGRDIC